MAREVKKTQNADISEIEAAIRLRMSPELLKHCTQRALKSGNPRKLNCEVQDGTRWYEEAEIVAFDKFLHEPWPVKPKATRPHLPKQIRLEVKLEANCGCAICQHGANCEAAHIEPVSETLSHHPSGLIWLCPNHHTDFDKGIYTPRDVDLATVKAVKLALVNRRVRQWTIERNASYAVLQLIRQIEEMSAFLADANLKAAHGVAVALAVQDIAALQDAGKAAAQAPATSDPIRTSYSKLAGKIAKSARTVKTPSAISTFVAEAVEARHEFLHDASMAPCPLCKGAGLWHDTECPACGGDGVLGQRQAALIDLTVYQEVDCPICKGVGQYDGEPCPACGAERRMQRRYADQIDPKEYEAVDCPLCRGKGRHLGAECPACGGEQRMQRRYAEAIDLSAYEKVDCPLCHGSGNRNGINCEVCQGERQIERRFADQVDLSDYNNVPCRLCGGKGQFMGFDCHPCGGEGQIEQQHADRIDWSDYDLVKCPTCRGTGQSHDYDCRSCGGEGKIFRRQLGMTDD